MTTFHLISTSIKKKEKESAHYKDLKTVLSFKVEDLIEVLI